VVQANDRGPAPGTYDEYLDRATWQPSEGLHLWLSRRLLTNFADVAGLVPQATRILEIGTGTGRTGHEASRLGFREYVGVEPTAALAEAARSRYSLTII
jgi:SAM-dependent methyltransferase